MNNPSQVLSVFAKECISKTVSQIIRKLQRFKETLSGDDSGLENTWDEICVQLQDEYSYHWDLYEDIVQGLIEEEVNKMANHVQVAIWLETESAFSFVEEIKLDTVSNESKSKIFQKAGDWSNEKIRRYLERG